MLRDTLAGLIDPMVDRAGAHPLGGHPNEGLTGGCSRSTELAIVALKRSWRQIFRWKTRRQAEKRKWPGFEGTTEALDSRTVGTAQHKSHRTIDPNASKNPRPEGAESTLTGNAASPFPAEPRQFDFIFLCLLLVYYTMYYAPPILCNIMTLKDLLLTTRGVWT